MLSIFPTNSSVKVFTAGEPDRFGMTKEDKVGTVEACILSFNTKLEKIPVGVEGREVVFTASMYFPKAIKVKVDDWIELIDDLGNKKKKKVMQVQFKRDFAGQVFGVKVVV